MTYEVGKEVERNGALYKVIEVYSLTDDEMEENNLEQRHRVTLRKVKGEGRSQLDFANPDYLG